MGNNDFNKVLYEESKEQGDFLALANQAEIRLKNAGLDKILFETKIGAILGMNPVQIVGYDPTNRIITYRTENDRTNTSQITVQRANKLAMRTGYGQ